MERIIRWLCAALLCVGCRGLLSDYEIDPDMDSGGDVDTDSDSDSDTDTDTDGDSDVDTSPVGTDTFDVVETDGGCDALRNCGECETCAASYVCLGEWDDCTAMDGCESIHECEVANCRPVETDTDGVMPMSSDCLAACEAAAPAAVPAYRRFRDCTATGHCPESCAAAGYPAFNESCNGMAYCQSCVDCAGAAQCAIELNACAAIGQSCDVISECITGTCGDAMSVADFTACRDTCISATGEERSVVDAYLNCAFCYSCGSSCNAYQWDCMADGSATVDCDTISTTCMGDCFACAGGEDGPCEDAMGECSNDTGCMTFRDCMVPCLEVGSAYTLCEGSCNADVGSGSIARFLTLSQCVQNACPTACGGLID